MPHPICGLPLFAVVILSFIIIAILIVLEMDYQRQNKLLVSLASFSTLIHEAL